MIREAQHDVMRWYACGSLLSDVTEWTLGCLRPNMGILVSSSKRCRTLLPCYQYFYFNTYDHKHCHYTLGLPCWLFCWRIWKSKLRKAVSNNLKLCTHVCLKHFHWRKYSEYSKEVKSRNCVQCTYVCPKHFVQIFWPWRRTGWQWGGFYGEQYLSASDTTNTASKTRETKTKKDRNHRDKRKNDIYRLWHLEHHNHNQNQRDKNKKG